MNDLIKTMSNDMGIIPYHNETESSFLYRIVFSGLGQWCLKSACSSFSETIGVTKHYQTSLLNELLNCYIELMPTIASSFFLENFNFSVFIRRVYEETGYLLTNENNRNQIANYGRTMPIGSSYLFFGITDEFAMEGLGLYTINQYNSTHWKEILIRDNLDIEQYYDAKFNDVLFNKKDISSEELQFFNPLLSASPSSSWQNKLMVDKTIGRKTISGPFYIISKNENDLLFYEEPNSGTGDMLTSHEYRRLYFALKWHHNNPVRVKIYNLDEHYSHLILDAHLPNREYYMLLLSSWPKDTAWNRREFIIKNKNITFISEMLENIGMKAIGG